MSRGVLPSFGDGDRAMRRRAGEQRLTSLSSGDIMCVDGPSPNCDPGYVCDPQPEGDPACVMPCVDPHGDDVLCLPGEICMDGTYCLDPSAGGPE